MLRVKEYLIRCKWTIYSVQWVIYWSIQMLFYINRIIISVNTSKSTLNRMSCETSKILKLRCLGNYPNVKTNWCEQKWFLAWRKNKFRSDETNRKVEQRKWKINGYVWICQSDVGIIFDASIPWAISWSCSLNSVLLDYSNCNPIFPLKMLSSF